MVYQCTTQQFIEKSQKTHNNFYKYDNCNYIKNSIKISIFCPLHGEFYQRPDCHLKGKGCPTCGKIRKSTKLLNNINDFIERSCKVHKNKYNYDKAIYNGVRSKLVIICPIHGEFLQIAHNHINGMGCAKCGSKSQKTIITKSNNEFIAKCVKIHGDKYNYDKTKYKGNKNKICITCNIHGDFYQRAGAHLLKSGCPKCKNSKGENAILNFFKNVIYVPQKTFSDCKNINPLPFDFYIPHLNLCIEFQGKQHYNPIKHWGGEIALKETQFRDKLKENYCRRKGIKLHRISYKQFKYLDKILSNILKPNKI